jgi:pantoate--beta-alanine ligase
LAKRRADRVVVSIFVNPAQFAPHEDFGNYPRTWDADVMALAHLKVDAIWAPSTATMYPEGFATNIVPGGPALAGLEDKFRPHFFGGVCTVVAKLLLQVPLTSRPSAKRTTSSSRSSPPWRATSTFQPR